MDFDTLVNSCGWKGTLCKISTEFSSCNHIKVTMFLPWQYWQAMPACDSFLREWTLYNSVIYDVNEQCLWVVLCLHWLMRSHTIIDLWLLMENLLHQCNLRSRIKLNHRGWFHSSQVVYRHLHQLCVMSVPLVLLLPAYVQCTAILWCSNM